MTCPDCERAAENALTPRFNAACMQCSARMIAHGQDFWRSAKARQRSDDYLRILETTFGFDLAEWDKTVREWAKRIHQAKQWAEMRAQKRSP